MKFLRVAVGSVLAFMSLGAIAAEQSLEEKVMAVQKVDIIDRPALMVGMGMTQILTGDYYIGALYLDENVQFDGSHEFLLLDVPRRMEFRIASERDISARSFSRKLAEGIRINNKREDVTAQKAGLGRLMKLFRGTYKKGDVIQFDYHKNFGTRVRYNNRILGEVPGSENLYKLLVNVWIGERPPSSKFKEGIVGKNDGEYAIHLLKRFVSL